MTNLYRFVGPAARRPHFGRWAALCFSLFCLGIAFQVPVPTRAASPGQEPTPIPSPTPTCEQRCTARAHEVYEACIAEGRGPEACEKESNAAREVCQRGCHRPTAVPSCEATCRHRAEAVFKECIAAGRGEEACHKESSEAKEACMRECPRPDVTATPKPAEHSCEQRCAVHAEEVYKTCIADGRGPDVCHKEAREAKAACLKDCPREATKTPVAEEKSCERHCAAEAEAVYKACIAGGHGPDVCEREAKAAREKCVRTCPKPEPTRIGNCDEKCKQRFEEVYHACIASGRGPDVCEAEAHRAKAECLKVCPRPDVTKTPQPLSCEGRCRERAAAEFKACIHQGGDEKACHERSNRVLQDCMHSCPKPAPKPEGCRDHCNAKAEAVYKACRDRGAGEEDCREEKTRAFTACVATCERPTESCEAGCKHRAEAVFKACKAEGGEDAACRERMRTALEVCLKSCPQPQPVDCQERCGASARAVLAKCVAEGGEQQACEVRAKASFDACIQHCDRPVPPAPIQDCSTKCARAGAAVFQRCMAGGGTIEGCTENMAHEIQRCLTECLRPGAVPPAKEPLERPAAPISPRLP